MCSIINSITLSYSIFLNLGTKQTTNTFSNLFEGDLRPKNFHEIYKEYDNWYQLFIGEQASIKNSYIYKVDW